MTISRRQFCAALGAAGLSATALPAFGDDKRPQPLRVIAYNVYACKGWPDDRPLAKKAVQKGQMARRLAMELALYEPDIINFSESPSEAVAKEVAKHLGMNHVRFPSGGNWPGTLLSKFEITDSVERGRRELVRPQRSPPAVGRLRRRTMSPAEGVMGASSSRLRSSSDIDGPP